MTDYQKYINALRKCAKEHENDRTSIGHIIVSDLCRDTANLLEALEQEPCDDAVSLTKEAYTDLVDRATKYSDLESCEDCVSRKEANKRIKAICAKYGLSYEDGERKPGTGGSAYALGHAFDDLPSVISTQRWIPVSEELPDEDDLYLCTSVDKEFNNEYIDSREYYTRTKRFEIDEYDGKVIAWMPLPKPYKAESEVEE